MNKSNTPKRASKSSRTASLSAAQSANVPADGFSYSRSFFEGLVDSALEFWLTTGRFNAAFQARLAKRIGAAAGQTMAGTLSAAGVTPRLR